MRHVTNCYTLFTSVAAILGVKEPPPHFPEWGVTYKAVTPSFDAMLVSLFSLYVLVMDGDSCR